jgi:hypothetical protein
LHTEWEAHLGSTEDAIYGTAVCPGGSAHVFNSNGRLISVDSGGGVFQNTLEPRLLGFRAAACDADDTVSVVTVRGPDTNLLRFRSSAGSIELTPVGRVGIPITALEAVPGRGLLALSLGDDGYLTWVGPDAKPSPRFGLLSSPGDVGDFKRGGEVGSFDLRPAYVEKATVIWDARNNRILVFPANPHEMHIYSAAGEFIARKVRKTRDRVYLQRMVLLPSGNLAAQLERWMEFPGGLKGHGVFLEIVDRDLREVATGPLTAGGLQGASASGDLYFRITQAPGPRSIGVNLLKVRITGLD